MKEHETNSNEEQVERVADLELSSEEAEEVLAGANLPTVPAYTITLDPREVG